MAEQIYHLNEQGQLAPMSEEPFELEDRLQELVAEHPGLLSGEQMNPDSPRRFILIGREQGIADIVGGGNRWALDHLLIDQDAVPTLVEAKRSSNPQIRREIVGQMMDYAAHATQTWNVENLRQVFEERIRTEGQDPEEILVNFLDVEEADVEGFWQDVETNLKSARLRLLFVSDGIAGELAQVIEFLNKQMPWIEVLGVEVKQFVGETGKTLVPRVIGRTAPGNRSQGVHSSSRSRKKLTREDFLVQMPNQPVKESALRLMAVTEQEGGIVQMGDTGVSLRFKVPGRRNPVSLAWIYPIPNRVFWAPTRDFTFGMGLWNLDDEPPRLVEILEEWISDFCEDSFSVDLSDKNLSGWAISHEDAANNIDLLCQRLQRVLRELRHLEPADI